MGLLRVVFAAVLLVGSNPGYATSAAPAVVLEANSRNFVIIDDEDRLDAVLVDGLDPDTYIYHPAATACPACHSSTL